MDKISVIVPCFNEEDALPSFYKETTKHLRNIRDTTYELIFIDDGSTDHTIHLLKDFSSKDSNTHYLSFSRNFGKEAAMYAGLQKATGEYTVIMDADLQHPPALLKEMYEVLKEGNFDCCAGKRMDRSGENKIRSILSRTFYKIIQKVTHLEMSDGAGDFRMMNKKVVNAILEVKEYNRYMKGIFSFVGFNTKWIPFNNIERVAGKTKWSIKSLFSYAFEGIYSYSIAPLKFSSMIGMFLIFSSFILGGGLIYSLIANKQVNDSFYLLILLLFLSGLQMVFVGILGQYIFKDYLENKNRPIYIVKETDIEK